MRNRVNRTKIIDIIILIVRRDYQLVNNNYFLLFEKTSSKLLTISLFLHTKNILPFPFLMKTMQKEFDLFL